MVRARCGHGVGGAWARTYCFHEPHSRPTTWFCPVVTDQDQPIKMSSQDETAKLFQKVVVFAYMGDNNWFQTKDILVSRDKVAQYDVRGVLIISSSPLN